MPPSSSSNGKVVKAVVATAAATLIIAGIFFFFFRKFRRCCKRDEHESSFRREAVVNQDHQDEFKKCGKRVKGWLYEENGRDVLYMRKLEDGQHKTTFPKVMFNPSFEEEEEEKRIDNTVERSRKSKPQAFQLPDVPCGKQEEKSVQPLDPTLLPQPLAVRSRKQMPEPTPYGKKTPVATPPPPPPPPPPPSSLTILANKSPPSPPLPPPPIPALPPILVKKNPSTPASPPKSGGSISLLRPPPLPRVTSNNRIRAGTSTEGRKETGFGRMKLKPLHWDKVMADADHSMVWDQIKDGSLRFDDELIETLFGYSTANRNSPQNNTISETSGSSNLAPTAQVFILDPRKSQNTAIVLKSLAISRKEIIDALREGQELSAETLEKLANIAPTKEEEAKILQFNGNPTKLADAESFLYHVLKAVPSAFMRTNAMLFKQNYESEILNLKESVQTLELACKELRNQGLFLKLLEAILKAGNRMNAGTARGNAKGFNLRALQKLSDVKSTDGKTTLLHFVVEQVVRSEGRRQAVAQNHSLGRSNSQNGNSNLSSSDSQTTEEKEKEYLMLGLPALGALSNEFSNVKTAATIEYESFINACYTLTTQVAEIRQLLTCRDNDEMTRFVREMKEFLEECSEELGVVRGEQIRVMQLVKRTTEYYQAGASKEKETHPLQLFVIVKDFLDMVDRVRADITRKLQRKSVTQGGGSSPPSSPSKLSPLRARNFRFHFMSDLSATASSSESDDDF
ncbi:hypothetical protein SLEP1_g25121 [Rubroshorea leprosula]|uniref:Formin-like protein n=1 Tax=Rubroshorea leprosula TaxID=152421 RepID=A0AAV5JP30_9ROSI|nr:hypothetical protein SLEP1_g25121 [Rubroshorea leprosula]